MRPLVSAEEEVRPHLTHSTPSDTYSRLSDPDFVRFALQLNVLEVRGHAYTQCSISHSASSFRCRLCTTLSGLSTCAPCHRPSPPRLLHLRLTPLPLFSLCSPDFRPDFVSGASHACGLIVKWIRSVYAVLSFFVLLPPPLQRAWQQILV
jgi:hypothetical protein